MAKVSTKKAATKKAVKVAPKKAAPKKTACKKTACKKEATKAAPKKTAKAAAPKAAKPAAEEIKKVRKVTKPKNEKTNSYSQTEFIENVRAFCGLAKRSQAKELCEDISLLIKEALKKGYKLPLMGLGKMYVRRTKARTGRNPATGETIQIASKKRVRFVPAKALKESVL
ncbi:MAG: HU family DNA-binding protein [Bdellovibrionota bacterium]|jgi:DNA-binding protein HU-beta